MNPDLESQLLTWIGEELAQTLEAKKALSPVPVKLLMMRLAIATRNNGEDLTKSVELSLNTFDRATLFRVLRQLHRKNLIEIVDLRGRKLPENDLQTFYAANASDKILGFVSLTEPGALEYKRLKVAGEGQPQE